MSEESYKCDVCGRRRHRGRGSVHLGCAFCGRHLCGQCHINGFCHDHYAQLPDPQRQKVIQAQVKTKQLIALGGVTALAIIIISLLLHAAGLIPRTNFGGSVLFAIMALFGVIFATNYFVQRPALQEASMALRQITQARR